MKKYIRGIICVFTFFIRLCVIKLFNFKRFKCSFINVISPFTEFELDKKATLVLGKFIKMRSGSKIKVRKNAEIMIGNNTSLNHNCIFTAHKKILIGENVQFGPNVLIYDHDHDFRKKNGLKNLNYISEDVIIGNNVWIGANVTILRGTIIGDNCVVAAGSTIKGSFIDNSIVIQKRDTQILNYAFED